MATVANQKHPEAKLRLKSVRIKNFRRFTDLTVQGIPETTRIIVLAGPNGCGKSSFLDALTVWRELGARRNPSWDYNYHVKGTPFWDPGTPQQEHVRLEFHDRASTPDPQYPNELEQQKKSVYIRTAYRNDPTVQLRGFQKPQNLLDNVRITRLIQNDAAVGPNYDRLVGNTVADIFESTDDSLSVPAFRDQIVSEIDLPLRTLFPDLAFTSLGNPTRDGTFRFTKGTIANFDYMNLSSGEKAGFDLILDLVVVRGTYDNTLYCIDEPEAHMNARIQADLLSVIFGLIPANCQLLLPTHSIGIMRQARDIEAKNPGTVCFLDFDGLDFDDEVVITPTVPSRAFWNATYRVALDDLASLVAPERVVICEGKPPSARRAESHSLDAECYDTIFRGQFPETTFVSMGGNQQVIGDYWGLADALHFLIDALEVIRLIDRDSRSDREVAESVSNGIRVLSRRNLESYLFDDEVLYRLAEIHRPGHSEELIARKAEILNSVAGRAADDLKPAAGPIYRACKGILELTNPGNDTKAFMRDTLAPLIVPGMDVYDELRQDIFGPEPGTTELESASS